MINPNSNPPAGEKRKTGTAGEKLAAQYLKKKGYKILAQNLTNKIGEIDLLAEDKRKSNNAIVIVEVKTKAGNQFGEGYEMVHYFKRHKLIQLAKILQIKYPKRTIRLDIVSINTEPEPPEINHFENAIEDVSKIS